MVSCNLFSDNDSKIEDAVKYRIIVEFLKEMQRTRDSYQFKDDIIMILNTVENSVRVDEAHPEVTGE